MPEPTIKDLYKQLSQAETRTAAHVELNWAIEELERAARPLGWVDVTKEPAPE